jgi:DNA repair exonuclease SbcCD ATPase subunit
MLVDKEAGEKYKENTSEAISNHSTKNVQSSYNPNTPAQPTFNDYIDHTSAILQSPSVFSTALKSNIEAFYFGLKINQDLDAAHNLLRQHAQLFQAQNQTINNLKNKIDNLEVENKNLKDNNDNQEERIKAIEERLLALNTLKSA